MVIAIILISWFILIPINMVIYKKIGLIHLVDSDVISAIIFLNILFPPLILLIVLIIWLADKMENYFYK